MKFLESHFDDYLSSNAKENLHPKLEKIFDKFPKNIRNLRNIIFFGAQGTGKYTQMLRSIKKYSPSELKYEKRICVMYNKQSYFYKISDIHFELDMSLLGCNSKLLWHEIYMQIIDIVSTKSEKSFIIVCKNFFIFNPNCFFRFNLSLCFFSRLLIYFSDSTTNVKTTNKIL